MVNACCVKHEYVVSRACACVFVCQWNTDDTLNCGARAWTRLCHWLKVYICVATFTYCYKKKDVWLPKSLIKRTPLPNWQTKVGVSNSLHFWKKKKRFCVAPRKVLHSLLQGLLLKSYPNFVDNKNYFSLYICVHYMILCTYCVFLLQS